MSCHALHQKIFLTPWIEPGSSALRADSLLTEPPGKLQTQYTLELWVSWEWEWSELCPYHIRRRKEWACIWLIKINVLPDLINLALYILSWSSFWVSNSLPWLCCLAELFMNSTFHYAQCKVSSEHRDCLTECDWQISPVSLPVRLHIQNMQPFEALLHQAILFHCCILSESIMAIWNLCKAYLLLTPMRKVNATRFCFSF